ncbi:MAG: hypothetical protein AAGF26_15050, partial [Cyanobacteria bacterium P01_G01_bin.49]
MNIDEQSLTIKTEIYNSGVKRLMMLSALIWIPLVGAALIAFLPGKQESSFDRFLGILVAIILIIVTLILGFQFDPSNPNIQFTEYLPWITGIGLSYHLGVDG